MFVGKIGLLTVVVAALLPALVRGQEADTVLTRIRQNKAVTIGFRESAAPFAYLDERKQASGYIPSTSATGSPRRSAASSTSLTSRSGTCR